MTWWMIPLAATIFGCAAYLAIQLSAEITKKIVPFDDGPPPGRPPTLLLIVGATIIGGLLGTRDIVVPVLASYLILIAALAACWYADVRVGILPDYFTLVPMGIIWLLALALHRPASIISSIALFIPFAIAAFVSKGRGMGWGDVKLVALGAAVLPMETSFLALAAACLGAVVIAAIRKRRNEPIAFAPYIAASISIALIIPVLV